MAIFPVLGETDPYIYACMQVYLAMRWYCYTFFSKGECWQSSILFLAWVFSFVAKDSSENDWAALPDDLKKVEVLLPDAFLNFLHKKTCAVLRMEKSHTFKPALRVKTGWAEWKSSFKILLSILKYRRRWCEQPVHTEGVRAFPEQLTRRTTGLTQQPGGYTSDPQSPWQATKFVIAVGQKVTKAVFKQYGFPAGASSLTQSLGVAALKEPGIQWFQWSDILIWLAQCVEVIRTPEELEPQYQEMKSIAIWIWLCSECGDVSETLLSIFLDPHQRKLPLL